MDRVQSWNTHEWVKPECGKKIYDYLKDPDLYDHIVPLDGAVEGLRRIRELGIELQFCTSNTYGMTDQKARCLERHGIVEQASGNQLPHELMIGHNKHWLHPEAVLVEDRGDTIKKWIESGGYRRAILFEYAHNASLDLTSHQWQSVKRAPAYPDPRRAWDETVEYFERAVA